MTGHADKLEARRRARVRAKLRKVGGQRPRLSVFRSGLHIYAQLIDDGGSRTLVAASTLDKDLKDKLPKTANIAAAAAVGTLLAARATAAGVADVVFDRGGYKYHGRVKALAEAARAGGLKF